MYSHGPNMEFTDLELSPIDNLKGIKREFVFLSHRGACEGRS
jgi:hypothetical protein